MKRITSLIIILLIDFRSHSSPTGCQNDEWQCKDGACISESARCDNFPDCMDNSDEENCSLTPVCLEGLESCPQPNGTTVCVKKAVGCSCGPIKEIDNGKIESDSITIGSEAAVVCNAGYDATLPTVTCQVTGLWETASCLPKDCGTPANIAFGKVTLSDIKKTKYGANADVECNVGFETLTPVIKCDETGSWGTAVCTAKDCGPVAKISFGKVILRDIDNTTYGAKADVVCDAGFDTITHVIKCDEKGSWGTAVCTAKDCGAPSKITFGKITLSDINNTTYGANADVECDVGFETITPVIKCDETGSWGTAVCTSKDCGAPGNIAYGKVVLSDINNTTYGANADVECNVGFETLSPVIKCDETGSWGTAVCTAKDCGAPSKITFGKVTLSDINNTTYGANADVECDVGFETLTPVIKCDETGSWGTAVCTAKDCGPVAKIAFGKVILSDMDDTTYGATADVECDVGFETLTPVIKCDEKGSWETAVCTAKDCGPVAKISFGKVILSGIDNTTYGANADVVCDVGFDTITPVIKCDETGSWGTAVCTAKDCGQVAKIAFGKVILSDMDDTTYGAKADVECDVGFETFTPVIKCDEKGSWETAVCSAKDCGPVAKISFAKVILSDIDNTTYGANADVVCDVGFETVTPVIKCDEKGSWGTAVCTAKDCGAPVKIAFGKVTLSDISNTTYGANADVVCDVGFETLTPVIKCYEKGSWGTAFCTAKDCGAPGKMAYGKVVLSDIDNTTYDANADVVCDVGFETLTPVIKCDENGSWGTAVCTAKDCGSTPSVSFGRITLSDDTNSTFGATATVTCNTGYLENKQNIICQSSGVWEDAACLPRDCGPVQSIAFGTIVLADSNNTTFGASALVICDAGYESKTTEVFCLKTGLWERAECTIRGCGLVPEISHGTIKAPANDSVGSNASVVCDKGFESNVSSVFCKISGQWESASCTIKDCGPVTKIAFGKVTLSDINNTTYGANADVECDVGFETVTPVIKCDETGSWETAVCTAKDCGSTLSISFGKITLSDETNSTFGATATVTCNTGYLENKQNIICQSSGVWEDAACLPRDCGPVQSIAFGTIVLADSNNTTFGASALVTCDAGYESKTTEVFCLKTGLWERAECTVRGCGLVPEISHGTIKTPANDSVGSYASVVCDKGYEANVSSVFCKISGQWESASCTIKDCGHTPAIPFGQITPNNRNITTYGASANVTCYTGYTSNVSKVYCLSTGVWERSACKPIDCGPPPLIKHGNTFLGNYNKTTYGATAFVSCQFNYVATRSVIKCQSSGTWENAACVFKGCGSLPEISHGTIKAPANVSIGSFANVTCDTGYEANVSSVMCKWSGLWETASCKAKDCGRTPWIPFGQSRPINYRNTSYGASARVTCFGGYESNVSTILCQSTGVWQTAVCRPKGCGPVPTILHGRIISTGNTSAGSTAIVTCDEGYTANVSSVMCKRSGHWEQANCSATNSGSLQCYKCSMECSNDVCNERTVVCPRYKQSCQAIIQWNHGYYTLKKGCKRPTANTANGRSKCRRIGYKIVCSYECNGNLCNWELPEIHSYG